MLYEINLETPISALLISQNDEAHVLLNEEIDVFSSLRQNWCLKSFLLFPSGLKEWKGLLIKIIFLSLQVIWFLNSAFKLDGEDPGEKKQNEV